eukprot:95211_1
MIELILFFWRSWFLSGAITEIQVPSSFEFSSLLLSIYDAYFDYQYIDQNTYLHGKTSQIDLTTATQQRPNGFQRDTKIQITNNQSTRNMTCNRRTDSYIRTVNGHYGIIFSMYSVNNPSRAMLTIRTINDNTFEVQCTAAQ